MTILAVGNQKGGVGKTITAVTLAVGCARRGLSVELVDLDPQGNVGDSLGLPTGNDLISTLDGSARGYQVEAGLIVVRSDKRTAGYKATLAGREYREYVLADALGNHDYDLVILDCAPSVDVLHVAALAAADWLLVPTKLDQYSIKGVLEMLVTLNEIRRRGGKCSLAGVVPTFYERNRKETELQLANLEDQFGRMIWPYVPKDEEVRRANREGKSLWDYAPGCRALVGIEEVGGYAQVVDKVVKLIK